MEETTATLSAGIPAEVPPPVEDVAAAAVEAVDDEDEVLAFLGATTTLLEEHGTQIGHVLISIVNGSTTSLSVKGKLADGAGFGLGGGL